MHDERTARIVLTGDFDVYRRQEIAAALPSPDAVDRVVLDMREVGIIDSSIIAEIMRFRRAVVQCGGDPLQIVIIVPPQLRRIFEIAGLTKSLTIVTAEPLAEA